MSTSRQELLRYRLWTQRLSLLNIYPIGPAKPAGSHRTHEGAGPRVHRHYMVTYFHHGSSRSLTSNQGMQAAEPPISPLKWLKHAKDSSASRPVCTSHVPTCARKRLTLHSGYETLNFLPRAFRLPFSPAGSQETWLQECPCSPR